MINLFKPYIPPGTEEEVIDTLRSGWIGQGPKVDKFEKEFGKKFKQDYCIAMNSGSSALETAYELCGIGEDSEVICTPLTCTATNIPLLRMGAHIVWADINPDTLCMDGEDVLRKITHKTKAIVNVHLGGIDNDLGDMRVPIISDACQALGVFNGDYVCNSFQAIKHITTGDGGMLTVNNKREYNTAKLQRWFGIDREKKILNNWQAYTKRTMTFDIDIYGYKRHMGDIAAGMGLVGLRHYNDIMLKRGILFRAYREKLKNVKLIDAEQNSHWLCTVLVKDRDNFAKMLFHNGVDTNLVQIRNDNYSIFGGKEELPVMDEIESQYISLPLHMDMEVEDVERICSYIQKGW